jgi:hypothetical protein
MKRASGALLLLLVGAAAPSAAQGYRVRVDLRSQTARFRGVMLDSIPASDTVSTPGQGPTSPDGFAVLCGASAAYCTFFRPGAIQRGSLLTGTTEATVWGVGMPGLRLHTAARIGVDLGSNAWPGTTPALQLVEGYAEYAAPRVTGRLGRQIVMSRLGTQGFDGARVILRDQRRGLALESFLGSGLARGALLPVTSPAVDPLNDFQPEKRQIVFGAAASWQQHVADVRAEYQREVDPRSDYFVSERVALVASIRLPQALRLSGGADYDLAQGWWGNADVALEYLTRRIRASLGARRYRPHFDLWTIWGAFSPVPYHAITVNAAVSASAQIEVRGRYEHYQFSPADVSTPLVAAEDRGWRWELGGTITPRPGWMLDIGYRREFGPGAAIAGLAGSVTYAPSRRLTITAIGSSMNRPLEFRFNEAAVRVYGVDAQVEAAPRLRVGVTATAYDQEHRRPDAAAVDWNQVRASARVIFEFGRGGDVRPVPPAIRMLPGGRSAR